MQLELKNLLIFEKKMPNASSQSNIASNAIDNDGNRYNLFISLEPSKTPKAVELICDQYNKALKEQKLVKQGSGKATFYIIKNIK